MKMTNIIKLSWLLIFAVSITLCSGDKVDEQLKHLNKPPLKTIESPDGDIIDCVPISQQVAFDNPSLKNHVIQMEPSSIPEGLSDKINIQQLWQLNGTCPKETIPVRRTKKEDILRAASIEEFGKKQHKSIKSIGLHEEPPAAAKHEYAVAYVPGGYYYGAKADINVWTPYVMKPSEFSLSQLWLIASPFDSNLNTIEAGWQEYPQLYGDYKTRLFIYWTRDNYQHTGCYNLACSGFIQTNSKIVLGGTLAPVSTYNGPQYQVTIFVWKDPGTKNWWLQVGNEYVGYWPSSMFNRLNYYANSVNWGGEIVNSETNGQHTSTYMGSGHFPYEGYGKASYFKNVQTVDASNTLRDAQLYGTATPSKYCYDIKIGTVPIASWRSYFYYGGSGRNSLCP